MSRTLLPSRHRGVDGAIQRQWDVHGCSRAIREVAHDALLLGVGAVFVLILSDARVTRCFPTSAYPWGNGQGTWQCARVARSPAGCNKGAEGKA